LTASLLLTASLILTGPAEGASGADFDGIADFDGTAVSHASCCFSRFLLFLTLLAVSHASCCFTAIALRRCSLLSSAPSTPPVDIDTTR
jgi:hypothetical protein